MALPGKGSRIIVVDGVRYRWVVTNRSEPDCGIMVELADSPRSRMAAEADRWAVIVPAMVATGIRQARQDGWDPWVPGPEFRSRHSLGGTPLKTP